MAKRSSQADQDRSWCLGKGLH